MSTLRKGGFFFVGGLVLGFAAFARSSPPCRMGQAATLTLTALKKNGASLSTTTTGYLGVGSNPDGAADHLVANVFDPDAQLPRTLILQTLP